MNLQLDGKRALVTGITVTEATEAYFHRPNSSGRLGTPADAADRVAVVASPVSGYVNGANLRVDGGSAVSIN